MKIGIDIDGVVLNFERELQTYAELYNFLELERGGVKNRYAHYIKERYDWSDEERLAFFDKYCLELSKNVAFMPGAVDVLKMLQKDGHKIVVVTARGGLIPQMKETALKKFEEAGLTFDKYFWKQHEKELTAKQESLDFMIDDNLDNCEKIAGVGVKALYFRDVNMKVCENNPLVVEVNNWGEVYRIIKNASKN